MMALRLFFYKGHTLGLAYKDAPCFRQQSKSCIRFVARRSINGLTKKGKWRDEKN
jgi:hypothetical protein